MKTWEFNSIWFPCFFAFILSCCFLVALATCLCYIKHKSTYIWNCTLFLFIFWLLWVYVCLYGSIIFEHNWKRNSNSINNRKTKNMKYFQYIYFDNKSFVYFCISICGINTIEAIMKFYVVLPIRLLHRFSFHLFGKKWKEMKEIMIWLWIYWFITMYWIEIIRRTNHRKKYAKSIPHYLIFLGDENSIINIEKLFFVRSIKYVLNKFPMLNTQTHTHRVQI